MDLISYNLAIRMLVFVDLLILYACINDISIVNNYCFVKAMDFGGLMLVLVCLLIQFLLLSEVLSPFASAACLPESWSGLWRLGHLSLVRVLQYVPSWNQ